MPRNPAARSALVGLVALVVALGWASCHGDSVVGLHPSVALDPSTLRMNPGDGFTLSVRVTDATGRAVAAPNVAWSSSNAAVVSVDTAGAVRAVGLGTASIRATYAAVTARSAVTVIPAATSCADPPGTLVEGEVASGTWRRVDGPYRLSGAVTADSLTLEPGTIVCGDAGATLSYRHVLRAEGSADLPVLFTATSPTDGWGGLRGGVRSGAEPDLTPGEAMLTHALVEYADTGIASGADLVDVVVRQTRGPGIAGPANALRTRVDSACTAGPPCAALDATPTRSSRTTAPSPACWATAGIRYESTRRRLPAARAPPPSAPACRGASWGRELRGSSASRRARAWWDQGPRRANTGSSP